MICPHCGNKLDNVIELNQSINQQFSINAAANPIGYYSPIWNTGNAPVINPINFNGNSAAPGAGTFTLIVKP